MKKKKIFKQLKKLLKKFPNDGELGSNVRKLYLKIKEKKNGVH